MNNGTSLAVQGTGELASRWEAALVDSPDAVHEAPALPADSLTIDPKAEAGFVVCLIDLQPARPVDAGEDRLSRLASRRLPLTRISSSSQARRFPEDHC